MPHIPVPNMPPLPEPDDRPRRFDPDAGPFGHQPYPGDGGPQDDGLDLGRDR